MSLEERQQRVESILQYVEHGFATSSFKIIMKHPFYIDITILVGYYKKEFEASAKID